ncbi:MAG: GTP diphosphokinase [Gammaproteobacteria bacterium]|nr:MAG: GTP diphosphokinase [Gammaproteobacteria bacterium]
MVQIRESHAFPQNVPDDLDAWLAKVEKSNDRLDSGFRESVLEAVEAVRAVEKNIPDTHDLDEPRENCLQVGLEMVEILAELGMDIEGLQASILYRAVRTQKLSLSSVRDGFGDGVGDLIESVLRMAVISSLRNDTQTQALGDDPARQTAKVREMLVSIIDDVRVALLKLAERTCAIRAVKNADDDKRRSVAREIFDVYAPLAHRLGIGHLKWELEDLAFRYMEPEEYQQIASLLAEKRSERQQYIDEMITTIDAELCKLGKSGEVSGRAKHIYSIWRKMHRKGIGFSQIYDIRAVRVLVSSVSDCYAVLGIVHSKWRYIPNEFDDYIASPKENGYRSLHTAVIGPGRKVIEIQIRTFAMHEEAEFGICAHWQYKDTSGSASGVYEEKIAWLRQVLEWHDNFGDMAVGNFLSLEGDPDRVYVFTPQGHVVDLPNGATPVDFAYRIHTQIGHRCRGARINHRMVPLDYRLQTADQVDIITGKLAAPSRDWMDDSLGFINSARAKNKVQHWFKSQHRDQNILAGKAILENCFHSLGLDPQIFTGLVERFNCKDINGLYQKVGAGELGLHKIISAAQVEGQADEFAQGSLRQQAQRFAESDYYIYGAADMPNSIAKCCNPHPGDPISGYFTKSHVVSIHRKDCGNLLRLQAMESHKTIELSWGAAPHNMFPVTVAIKSYDRGGLLRDITALIDAQGLFILALNTGGAVGSIAEIEITTEVDGVEQLSDLIALIGQIPNVVDVWRVRD